jgi:hypothetical protein
MFPQDVKAALPFGATEYANNNGKGGALSGRAQERLNRWSTRRFFSQPDPYTYGQSVVAGCRHPRALYE